MKQNLLTDAITELDDDLIEAADKQKSPLSKQSAIRWCIIAAAALFATTVTVYAVDTVISSPPSPPSPHTTTAPITEPMPILPAGMQEMTYTPTWYYASPDDAFWGEPTEGTLLRLSALVPEGWEIGEGTASLVKDPYTERWDVCFTELIAGKPYFDIARDPELGGALRITSWYDTSKILTGETKNGMRYAYCRRKAVTADGDDISLSGACGVLELREDLHIGFELVAPWGSEEDVFAILDSVECSFFSAVVLP